MIVFNFLKLFGRQLDDDIWWNYRNVSANSICRILHIPQKMIIF